MGNKTTNNINGGVFHGQVNFGEQTYNRNTIYNDTTNFGDYIVNNPNDVNIQEICKEILALKVQFEKYQLELNELQERIKGNGETATKRDISPNIRAFLADFATNLSSGYLLHLITSFNK